MGVAKPPIPPLQEGEPVAETRLTERKTKIKSRAQSAFALAVLGGLAFLVAGVMQSYWPALVGVGLLLWGGWLIDHLEE